MSNIKDLPKRLPDPNLPFTISCEGVYTGQKYEGSFIVRVPLTKDMSRIGIELARLNAGVAFEDLDSNTAILHNAVAFLKALLTDAPEWFVAKDQLDYGLNTYDSNVAITVFLEAEKQIEEWRSKLKVKSDV